MQERTWSPLALPELVALFGLPTDPWWWIAGGHAIELFAGRELRRHGDVDVLVLRRDQQRAREALPGWDLHAAGPPGRLRPWQPGSALPEQVHDVWCRPAPGAAWRLQLMFDEAEGNEWHSRRHRAVRRPITGLGRMTAQGWPYLAPEIQLFYKGTGADIRPKDELDFRAALPLLDTPARRWLDHALAQFDDRHPWRPSLA